MLSSKKEVHSFEGTHLSSLVPPYAMPPLIYENNQILMITIVSDPQVLRALVPEPLIVNSDDVMTIFIREHNIVDPIRCSYLEAGIIIPTAFADTDGVYMPVLYLDQTLPITIGREIWGFPKFEADFSFETDAETVRASVSRQGTKLMDATLKLGEPDPTIVSAPSFPVFLLKSIPSVKRHATPDIRQLNTAIVHDITYAEWHPGEASLQLINRFRSIGENSHPEDCRWRLLQGWLCFGLRRRCPRLCRQDCSEGALEDWQGPKSVLPSPRARKPRLALVLMRSNTPWITLSDTPRATTTSPRSLLIDD